MSRPFAFTLCPLQEVEIDVSSTVYIAQFNHPAAQAGVMQPAFRAWADALLSQQASKYDRDLAAAVSIRSTSQIGALSRRGMFTEPLVVNSSACFIAQASDQMQLFFPPAWRVGLVEYLAHFEYDDDMVEEHLLPCDAPLTPVLVDSMRQVLTETRSDFVKHIVQYFASDLGRYLESWRPLSSPITSGNDEEWEVVIPSAESAHQ